jgi:hypothetical protein
MIFVRLSGGLGNQLFQWATAIEIQRKTNRKILFYTGDLKRYVIRRQFLLPEISADGYSVEKPPLMIRWVLRYRINRLFPFLFPWFVNNQYMTRYIKGLPDGKWPGNKRNWYVLDDYFQNLLFMEQGIREVAAKITGTAWSDQSVTAEFTRLLDGNLPAEVAAVHIRRSDYLSKDNRKWFYLLGQEYYTRALIKLGPGIKKIVVFTDAGIDPAGPVPAGGSGQSGGSVQSGGIIQWPEDTIIIYRTGNDLSACRELLLFSRFTHLVIANSTFSFWAAISAGTDCPERVKIGPSHWSLDKKANVIWNNNLQMMGFVLL